MNPNVMGGLRSPGTQEGEGDNNPVTTAAMPPPVGALPPGVFASRHGVTMGTVGVFTDTASAFTIDPELLASLDVGAFGGAAPVRGGAVADLDTEPDPEPTEGLRADALRAMLRRASQELLEAQFWLVMLASSLSSPATVLQPSGGGGDGHSGNESAPVSAPAPFPVAPHPHLIHALPPGAPTLHDTLRDDAPRVAFPPESRLLCVLGIARALAHVFTTSPAPALARLHSLPLAACVCVPLPPRVSLLPLPWVTPSITDPLASHFWCLHIDACVSTEPVPDPLPRMCRAFGDLLLCVVVGAASPSCPLFTSSLACVTSALAGLSRTVSVEGGTLELLPDAVIDALTSVCNARCGPWPRWLGESLCILAVQARQLYAQGPRDDPSRFLALLSRLHTLCQRCVRPQSLVAAVVASTPPALAHML
ncbi:MAG: hypothetical protein P4L40_03455 [Terracidiphilus sp.]|nr:hypothetical protein [Terracidiphilus sp.]